MEETSALLWKIVGFLIAVIVIGGILTFISLRVQHDVVNPQLRQNIIDDPNTTIANKQDFHNKLGEVIKADQDVISDINLLSRYSKGDPGYDTALTNLTGVEEIRTTAINTYNAASDNPDKGKDMDPWMPRHIDTSTIPADDGQASTFLKNEIAQLEMAYNHQ